MSVRRTHRAALASAVALLSSWSSNGWALETPPLGDEPALVDVTESASVIVNLDNRNTRPADVASQVDDDWTMAYNRLNTQASWKGWRLHLRLDTAYYFTSRSPTAVGLDLLTIERRGREESPFTDDDADFFVQKFLQAGDELSDRFVDWTYPAKYGLSYESRDYDASVGDFYAQFGQGLVLSVRKQDELSSDTTVRGLRVTGKLESDELRLKATALGGVMNPLRIDEASGRHLAVTGSVLDPLTRVSEAGMPHAISNDFVAATPNYAPDRIVGVEIEGRLPFLAVGLAGTRLSRSCLDTEDGCAALASDLVRSAGTIDTGGVSIDLPRLSETAAAYVEYAHQRLSNFRGSDRGAPSGNAVYARLNWLLRPVALTLEGKHYRSFHPLKANVDIGRAREFSPLQYSTPPTTEAVWVDTEFEEFNTCVTGGRAKVDLELSRQHALFAWVGRYDTWGESAAAGSCQTIDDNLNRVWDLANGAEMKSRDRRTYGNAIVGTRFDSTDRTIVDARNQPTHVFYRELYLRHDVVVGLPGGAALQLQAWHRRRRQTLGSADDPWLQGQTTTGLQLSRAFGFAFGFEYDQNPAFPDLYFNGQARYDFDEGNLTLFGGQRQGGLRCVSGVCRIFPPFEGVRLDATLRF